MDNKDKTPLAGGAFNVIILRNDIKNSTPKYPYGQEAIRIADDPTMQRAVRKICSQGDRMVLELLSTLAEKDMRSLAVEAEIKRFALLPEGVLHAFHCQNIPTFSPMETPE